MLRIVALKSLNECDSHARGEIGVFAVGFLAASPARIAKDIDVRGPDGEALVPLGRSVFGDGGVVFGAEFGADDVADLAHEGLVESGGHADGLWKDSGSPGAGYAVKTFIPPVVFGNAKARNSGGSVSKLGDFLFERHARDEIVDAPVERNRWVFVSWPGG